MRNALALCWMVPLAALALAPACAQDPSRGMQADPGKGYALQTTGAEVVGRDDPNATGALAPNNAAFVARLAAQICDRETRCHAATNGAIPARSQEDCWNESRRRATRELKEWRCSPGGARARAEECLAAIGHEPCEHDVMKGRFLCASNPACGADWQVPPSAP